MSNKLPTRTEWHRLAHSCSLHGGNPGDSLSMSHIATVYQIIVELSSSRGHHECNKFGGHKYRSDVVDGLWVVDGDMADHCSM